MAKKTASKKRPAATKKATFPPWNGEAKKRNPILLGKAVVVPISEKKRVVNIIEKKGKGPSGPKRRGSTSDGARGFHDGSGSTVQSHEIVDDDPLGTIDAAIDRLADEVDEWDGKTCCDQLLRFDPRARGLTVGGLALIGWNLCDVCGKGYLAKGFSRVDDGSSGAWQLAKGGRSLTAGSIKLRAEGGAPARDVAALMARIVKLPDMEATIERLADSDAPRWDFDRSTITRTPDGAVASIVAMPGAHGAPKRDFADGNTAWKPEYKGDRGTRALHELAYRNRMGIVGMLQQCICTWPLEIEPTLSGHHEACPTESHTRNGHATYILGLTFANASDNVAAAPVSAHVGGAAAMAALVPSPDFQCPVNSQECLVRGRCTNKCGRNDARGADPAVEEPEKPAKAPRKKREPKEMKASPNQLVGSCTVVSCPSRFDGSMPPDWRAVDGFCYCPTHVGVGERAAKPPAPPKTPLPPLPPATAKVVDGGKAVTVAKNASGQVLSARDVTGRCAAVGCVKAFDNRMPRDWSWIPKALGFYCSEHEAVGELVADEMSRAAAPDTGLPTSPVGEPDPWDQPSAAAPIVAQLDDVADPWDDEVAS